MEFLKVQVTHCTGFPLLCKNGDTLWWEVCDFQKRTWIIKTKILMITVSQFQIGFIWKYFFYLDLLISLLPLNEKASITEAANQSGLPENAFMIDVTTSSGLIAYNKHQVWQLLIIYSLLFVEALDSKCNEE